MNYKIKVTCTHRIVMHDYFSKTKKETYLKSKVQFLELMKEEINVLCKRLHYKAWHNDSKEFWILTFTNSFVKESYIYKLERIYNI